MAAESLNRDPYITDNDGFYCDLLAAAVHPDGHRLAYVEQRAKQDNRHIDITIKIHLLGEDEQHRSVDIKSYNPYSGCHVRYFAWWADTAVLIYREKHRTYAAQFGATWPPDFREIADRWLIARTTLAYLNSNGGVSRLSLPELTDLQPMNINVAREQNLLPPDLDGFLDWPEKEV
ncbi:hypothetical protein Enr13x_10860 [Stieleria neptunia]|uniref:Uncharacterized protein n=2 Tax=Stieleria neptunia TaxID=2527979 RepID=A0A518HK77_9BACT|nr:hypothetical protein Enr13x_10860 [Stieleria neptunia]